MNKVSKYLIRRIVLYFVGLFIMTIGIALSVKSNLGVSPVSSIPNTMTLVWGIEMGNATIMFHCVLVVIQILVLRKKFKPVNLLQIAVGIIFGKFTTLCNSLVAYLPAPSMPMRILMLCISIVVIAIGIFFYMPANIMPLAGEGAMGAVSDMTGIEFPKVKIGFDVSMVVISLITCLVFLHGFGSVGIGTIAAAFLVGVVLKAITKRFGAWRDSIMYAGDDPEDE